MNKDRMRYIVLVTFAAANDEKEMHNLNVEKAEGLFSPLELVTIDLFLSMFAKISEKDGVNIVSSTVTALSYVNEAE